jgi:hypothetical protein
MQSIKTRITWFFMVRRLSVVRRIRDIAYCRLKAFGMLM